MANTQICKNRTTLMSPWLTL